MSIRGGFLIIGCAALALAGCQDVNRRESRASIGRSAERNVTAPVDIRRQRTRDAMRGLRYDSGRVVIVEDEVADVSGRGDAKLAWATYESGLDLLGRNARTRALAQFTQAVIRDPSQAEFYLGLGESLLGKRKLNEAEAAFRTGLDLDGDNVELRVRLADALQRRGALREAVDELNEVLEQEPDNGFAHVRAAVLHYYLAETDLAWQHLSVAEDLGEPYPAQLPGLMRGDINSATARSAGSGVQVGPQVRVDVGAGIEACNETSCAGIDANPQEVVASWNDWRDSGSSEVVRMGVAVSHDAGETWTDFLVRAPAGHQTGVEGDPMTCFDQRTGTLWVGAISFGTGGGVFVARKEAGEASFEPSVMAHESAWADKGWMAAGIDPEDSGATRVYVALNDGVVRSTDMGATWAGPVNLGYGLGFLPRVGPAGELYVAYWDNSYGIKLRRSFNGGLSFTTHTIAVRMDTWDAQNGSRFAGNFRVPPLAAMAVDPNDGTLYAVYFDTTSTSGDNYNVDLYFTRSDDQGTSWSTPVILNDDTYPPGDQFFPWLEVDQHGRLHLVFHDSRYTIQDDDTTHGRFDAMYSLSTDGGASWSEYRLTPQSFDSYYDGLDRPGSQFLGDYNGLGFGGNFAYPCYISTQNGDADIFVNRVIVPPVGDLNCDGYTNFDDINGFVLALVGEAEYEAIYPDCAWLNADCDENDAVNFDDIDGFVSILAGQAES